MTFVYDTVGLKPSIFLFFSFFLFREPWLVSWKWVWNAIFCCLYACFGGSAGVMAVLAG